MNVGFGSYFLMMACAIGVVSVQQMCAADSKPIVRADSLPETTPWDLRELSEPPEFTWGKGDKVRALYYKGEPYKSKATRVFAYYATPGTLSGDPAKDVNLPAIVLVHGGLGTAFPKWAELWAKRGYAAIAMDLTGCGPGKKRLADGGPGERPNHKFYSIDQPVTEQWTYHAVANVIRAHSLIRSFHEVDAERTAITGISWGGYATCIVAGLDNRFKAAVPVYGCGFIHEASSLSSQREKLEKLPPELRAKWVQLWDPSQYIGSAAMPMLFVNGGTDGAYPVDTHAKTYALVQSPKNLHFVPSMPHGHIFNRPKAIEVFINHHLRKGLPLAKIAEPTVSAENVIADVASETKLVTARLHYSRDPLTTKNENRKWITEPATIEGDRITARHPPEQTHTWFITVKDDRDTTVSSRLVLPSRCFRD